MDTGFFMVSNHGVSSDLVNQVHQVSANFFTQPLETKRKSQVKTPNIGYLELYEEILGGVESKGDFKEGFDMPCYKHDDPFKVPDVPMWEEAMTEYRDHMILLCNRLTRALALSLDLPEKTMDYLTVDPYASLRLLHYPPSNSATRPADEGMASAPHSENELGAGAHTDYGLMTVVAQDQPGLQILTKNHGWIEAPFIPGSFVVNIGDIVPRLTNDLYTSSPHRVYNFSGTHRYSNVFFFDPAGTCEIDCLPSLRDPDGSSRYAPCTFSEHWQHMIEVTYRKQSDTAV